MLTLMLIGVTLWEYKIALVGVVLYLWSAQLVECVQRIINWFRGIRWRKPLVPVQEDEERLEGIPVREIVAFVIKHDGFPTLPAKQWFQVRNERLQAIAQRLEDIGILQRWPNNSRVLAEWIRENLKRGEIDITKKPSPTLVKVSATEMKYIENPLIYAEKAPEKDTGNGREMSEKTERIVQENPELA